MVMGGIHNPEIDPMKHFNCQDRFTTIPLSRMAQLYLQNMFSARIALGCVVWPVLGILFWVWIDMRREPMEVFMEREEYWQDYDSRAYGVYFDHHHFSHQLCHRRANKWGYEDVTLAHGHH